MRGEVRQRTDLFLRYPVNCNRMIRSMFKLKGPKRFQYAPRYFDPVKEELEHRVREAKIRGEGRLSLISMRRQAALSGKWEDASADRQFFARVQHQKNMSRLRFMLIINILFILIVFAIYKFL